MSVTNGELETLLTDSALAAIHPDTPLVQIEAALRSLAESVGVLGNSAPPDSPLEDALDSNRAE